MKNVSATQICEYIACTFRFKTWGGKKYCPEHTDMMRRRRIENWNKINDMKMLKPTEHYIQNAIIGYLKMKGYYVMRLNSGKYAVGEGRQRRFVMGQDAGTPDLMAFKGMNNPLSNDYNWLISLVFIEVKRPGMKPTALQAAKMEELTEYGARCIIATSIEDLEGKL